MKDYIEIKEEVYRDAFRIVCDWPIINTEEWERWVEPHNYRSHLIAIVPNPKLDPWGRPMLPYKFPHDKKPKFWGLIGWPAPPSDDMDRDNCMTVTSVGGKTVKLYRRTSEWVDPWKRAEKRKDGS
jgi:hypothetical protein